MKHQFICATMIRTLFLVFIAIAIATGDDSGEDNEEFIVTVLEDENILLMSTEYVINEIQKIVDEEIEEYEQISEPAGKCSAEIGEEVMKLTKGVVEGYVDAMTVKNQELSDILKTNKSTEMEIEGAKEFISEERDKIVDDLDELTKLVIMPQIALLAEKMSQCKSL